MLTAEEIINRLIDIDKRFDTPYIGEKSKEALSEAVILLEKVSLNSKYGDTRYEDAYNAIRSLIKFEEDRAKTEYTYETGSAYIQGLKAGKYQAFTELHCLIEYMNRKYKLKEETKK